MIFGKLITAHNSRLYLLNLLSNYLMLILWIKQCLNAAVPLTSSSKQNTFFYFFDVLLSLFSFSKPLFVLFVVTIQLMVLISFEILIMCAAISRGLTFRQLRLLSEQLEEEYDGDEDVYGQANYLKYNPDVFEIVKFKKGGDLQLIR